MRGGQCGGRRPSSFPWWAQTPNVDGRVSSLDMDEYRNNLALVEAYVDVTLGVAVSGQSLQVLWADIARREDCRIALAVKASLAAGIFHFGIDIFDRPPFVRGQMEYLQDLGGIDTLPGLITHDFLDQSYRLLGWTVTSLFYRVSRR